MGDFYVIFGGIFGDFLVGTGEPPPYCDKLLSEQYDNDRQMKVKSIRKRSFSTNSTKGRIPQKSVPLGIARIAFTLPVSAKSIFFIVFQIPLNHFIELR